MYLVLLMASVTAIASAHAQDVPQPFNAPQPPAQADSGDMPEAKRICRDARGMLAGGPISSGSVGTNPPPMARRLDELPTGNLELAVMREVDGCIEPTIIRQGFGAVAPPERR